MGSTPGKQKKETSIKTDVLQSSDTGVNPHSAGEQVSSLSVERVLGDE